MENQEQTNNITAIIKTHNCENTLCDVLESIKDLDEIIIVDEHSTDDTAEIAKEYKSKIIFADKNELNIGLNQAIQEAQNEWILILEDDEIIPQKLLFELQNYIENPKKNKFCISLPQKIFYLNKEIKSAKIRKTLRFFKKGYANFKNDYSSELKITQGKLHKLNKNFKIPNCCILKYIKKDFSTLIQEIIDKNKNKIKTITKAKSSIFIKPAFVFIKYYFQKGAIFDGKQGFIYSKLKYIEEFIAQNMILEKSLKGVQDDI